MAGATTCSSAIDTYCENNELVPILTLDITPKDKDSGKKTEPHGTSKVTISGLSGLKLSDEDELTVVHKKDDGIEELPVQYSNGTLTFDTPSFSHFAVAVDLGETAKAKQIKAVNGVSIEDDTLNTGRFILKANITTKDGTTKDYTGEEAGELLKGNDYTITWNNSVSDIGYGRVTLDNGKEVYNSAKNGGWVNVSYTYPNGSETTKVTYTVTVKKGGVPIPNGHAEEKTKYYKQLMNGSFEDCTFKYDNGAPLFYVPYWNATQNGNLLEVIGTGYSPLRNYFDTDRYVRDEFHAAELNATNEGTLYQTVLTVPGQTLYWSFSHRARTVSISGKTGFDKMAMLIVPEALAEELSENGDEYLRNWARGKGETATNGGFITVDEKDDNDKPYQIYVAQHQSEVTRSWSNDYYRWCYNSQWDDMSGDLTVPDDWYVVRFFFVAVDTCSSSISVGNIVDAVSFSQDVPSFEGYGAANVTVTKKVYGLDDLTETKAKELLNSKRFIDGVVLENWTKDTDSEGKVYYEASGTVTERMFSDKDVTYKEEFANAQLDGYKLTSAKAEYGSTTDEVNLPSEKKELEVNVTLQKGQDKTIVFTNTYTPATLDIRITKQVDSGDKTKDFKFKVTSDDFSAVNNVWLTVGSDSTQRKPQDDFYLKDGESATLHGLKEGYLFTIKEDYEYGTAGNYDTTATNNKKVEAGNAKNFSYLVVKEGNQLVLQPTEGSKSKNQLTVDGVIQPNITDGKVVVTNSAAATSLTVTKHVKDGNATAPSDNREFTFRLTVGTDTKDYKYVTFDKTVTPDATNKNVWTFTLQANDSIKISGIRLDDTDVKVEEVELDSHYTPSYKVNGTDSLNGAKAELGTLEQNSNTVEFTNTYNVPNLKSMTIQKKVTGAFGERTKEFAFSVELTDKAGAKVTGWNHTSTNANVTDLSSFKLTHGQSVELKDIPIGTTITVTETDADDYKTSATNYKVNPDKKFIYEVVNENGTAVLKSKDNNQTVTDNAITVTNNFDGTPDTGVLLDTLPYLILLAVAVAGGVLVVVRKRKHRDE